MCLKLLQNFQIASTISSNILFEDTESSNVEAENWVRKYAMKVTGLQYTMAVKKYLMNKSWNMGYICFVWYYNSICLKILCFE